MGPSVGQLSASSPKSGDLSLGRQPGMCRCVSHQSRALRCEGRQRCSAVAGVRLVLRVQPCFTLRGRMWRRRDGP